MNKELSPLECLKIVKEFALEFIESNIDKRVIIGGCEIIETALKEYDGAKKHIEALNKERIENSIKIKALEIIKEKNVDIRGIKETKDVHEYNVKFPTTLNEFLEEQEYRLLKEVLL